MLGSKNADEPADLTMVERMHGHAIWLKVKNYSAAAVLEAITQLRQTLNGHFSDVFKIFTADKGSELAELSGADAMGIIVYFTHPFFFMGERNK